MNWFVSQRIYVLTCLSIIAYVDLIRIIVMKLTGLCIYCVYTPPFVVTLWARSELRHCCYGTQTECMRTLLNTKSDEETSKSSPSSHRVKFSKPFPWCFQLFSQIIINIFRSVPYTWSILAMILGSVCRTHNYMHAMHLWKVDHGSVRRRVLYN